MCLWSASKAESRSEQLTSRKRQILEQMVEGVKGKPQERNSDRTVEQFAERSVPHSGKEIVLVSPPDAQVAKQFIAAKVVRLVPQE